MNFLKKWKEIDISKYYPQYFNKTVWRWAFAIAFTLQAIAVFMTGFNLYPAYFDCQSSSCENPFYNAPKAFCARNGNLCEVEYLTEGEIVGEKPPLFVRLVNPLGFALLAAAALLSYSMYEVNKKNGKNKN